MLNEILDQYLKLFPSESAKLKVLLEQIEMNERLDYRKNFRGHISGSAIVLSEDKTHILLIYSRVFNVWQQPGGHWDPDDANPLQAARREAIEETGINIANDIPVLLDNSVVPLDIDTHLIPGRPARNEPAHLHHDFRYVFTAKNTTLRPESVEAKEIKWFELHNPATARIQGCIDKLDICKFL